MCCLVSILLLFGPRLAIVVGYLFDGPHFDAAVGSFLVSCLGFIFLPWTLLAYVLVWRPFVGVEGFGWLIVALAFLIDLGSYGGGYRNRGRVSR